MSQARPNMKVLYLAVAKRILFSDANRAKRVLIASGDKIYVRKVVIVSLFPYYPFTKYSEYSMSTEWYIQSLA